MQNIFLFLIGLGIFMSAKAKTKAITYVNGKMKKRGCDAGGCGNFGASRDNGSRTHEGLDILCVPYNEVFAPFDGIIEREVDPYGDGRFSGLQIYVAELDLTLKIMYFEPSAIYSGQNINMPILKGYVLGYCQNISNKYGSQVPPHLHIETIKNGSKLLTAPFGIETLIFFRVV